MSDSSLSPVPAEYQSDALELPALYITEEAKCNSDLILLALSYHKGDCDIRHPPE